MRLFLIVFVLVLPAFLLAQSEDCHCLKPEIEIGLGPQLSSGAITEIEIPDSPELSTEPGGLGYSFHVSIRSHPAKFQVGLDVLQDLTNLNVYYPVYFPSDYPDHIGDSKWTTKYKAFRFGVGTHLRINFNTAFTVLGIAYMNPVSEEVTDEITSWNGEYFKHENVSYDGKSGVTLRALFGTRFGNGKWRRLSWNVGVSYDTGLNSFKDETFQRSWSFHNLSYMANLNFQLNKLE
jgi:hypothetical protein